MVSCASKRAAFVDSTIQEAVTLQAMAKSSNLEALETTEALIKNAEKQNEERQTEHAFVLADEAVLQLHLSMLKKENTTLTAENKAVADSLALTKESLSIYRNVLQERKGAPKEQVTH
jgi:hypothetical protein